MRSIKRLDLFSFQAHSPDTVHRLLYLLSQPQTEALYSAPPLKKSLSLSSRFFFLLFTILYVLNWNWVRLCDHLSILPSFSSFSLFFLLYHGNFAGTSYFLLQIVSKSFCPKSRCRHSSFELKFN